MLPNIETIHKRPIKLNFINQKTKWMMSQLIKINECFDNRTFVRA